MLRKLLKYDLKATSRAFFPVYLAVTALAVLTAIFNYLTAHILADAHADVVRGLTVLFMGLYAIAVVVLPFLTVFFCMRHFYDNYFKDEGYLMHTLPVTPAKLIWSKVITGGVWSLATSVVSAISGTIIVSGVSGTEMLNLPRVISIMVGALPKTTAEDMVTAILSVLVMLTVLICFLLMLYAALSIGSLVPKHHRGITVLMIIAFFLAHIIVMAVAMVAVSNAADYGWLDSLAHTFEPVFNNYWPFLWATFGCVMVYLVGFSALYFLITHYIMKRRLNLQ